MKDLTDEQITDLQTNLHTCNCGHPFDHHDNIGDGESFHCWADDCPCRQYVDKDDPDLWVGATPEDL